VVIRWLGAFRKKADLQASLTWELTQTELSAVAAEKLVKGCSAIYHARIGLLVANRAILRRYSSDVWSTYRNGKLVPTRKEGKAWSEHTECFVRPIYKAIVVKGKITDQALQACLTISIAYKIPFLRLTRDGKLVEVKGN